MNIIDALFDRNLFGALPAFADLSTWTRWIVFLKAVYGIPLTAAEMPIFNQHTGRGRYAPPQGGYREAVAIVGRQAGKDRIGSLIQANEAMTARPEPDRTDLYAISIAQDQRSSVRTAFSYATAPFDLLPLLAETVASKRADAWTLRNGVTLAAYPCRPSAVRGLRARVVVCSELAFFRTGENLPIDIEMLRALRPTLATTGGKGVYISSPYGQLGALWDLHRRHFGRDDSETLVWQATAPEMNPTLPADYLRRMEQDDPEAYRSEVLGEFRSGLSSLLDPEVLEECVASGIGERNRPTGATVFAFADVASGSGQDRFAIAFAHADGQHVVLDLLRTWSPPFNPAGVIAEAAALMKMWGLYQVTGDRYAPGFVAEAFRSHDIIYRFCDRDRSALYLELLPLVNSKRAVLLDLPELLRELRGLDRRRGLSGRDRVDHRPGSHDDRANATAGALVLASASVADTVREVPVSGYW